MGCANSSPLVNGGGPGGLVDTVKNATNDVVNSGENAMNGELSLSNYRMIKWHSFEAKHFPWQGNRLTWKNLNKKVLQSWELWLGLIDGSESKQSVKSNEASGSSSLSVVLVINLIKGSPELSRDETFILIMLS